MSIIVLLSKGSNCSISSTWSYVRINPGHPGCTPGVYTLFGRPGCTPGVYREAEAGPINLGFTGVHLGCTPRLGGRGVHWFGVYANIDVVPEVGKS